MSSSPPPWRDEEEGTKVDSWAVLVVESTRHSLMGPDPKMPELFATKAEAQKEADEWEDAKVNGWMVFPVRVKILTAE